MGTPARHRRRRCIHSLNGPASCDATADGQSQFTVGTQTYSEMAPIKGKRPGRWP